MPYYINYYFRNLTYNDHWIRGRFEAPDWDVRCCFRYDRETEVCTIWDSNKPVEEITPLPIHWLLWKLEKNNMLNVNESKVSY